MKKLDLKKALRFTWKTIKKNFLLIYGLVFIQTFLQSVHHLSKPYYYSTPFKSIVVMWETLPRFQWFIKEMMYPFVFLLLSAYISLIFIKVSIYAYEHDHQITLRKMTWSSFRDFLKYVWITLILVVFTALGFIALIIPGFIVSTTYLWVSCIVVEHPELSSKAIFQRSAQLTLGLRWAWFGVLLLVFLLVQGFGYLTFHVLDVNLASTIYTWQHALSNAIVQIILTPFLWLSYVFLYKSGQE